jgi:hypothetical protein
LALGSSAYGGTLVIGHIEGGQQMNQMNQQVAIIIAVGGPSYQIEQAKTFNTLEEAIRYLEHMRLETTDLSKRYIHGCSCSCDVNRGCHI